VVDVVGRLGAQVVEPDLHPVRSLLDRPGDVQRGGVEHVVGDLAELLQLVVAEDRLIHDQYVRLFRRFDEQVDLGAHPGLQAHHDLLTDGIDGWVGDLGEELLEVGKERRLAIREHGQRRVVTHAGDWLLAVGRHRRNDQAQILLGETESELP
jgi:hypothetical protein